MRSKLRIAKKLRNRPGRRAAVKKKLLRAARRSGLEVIVLPATAS